MINIGQEIDSISQRQSELNDLRLKEDRDWTEDEQSEYDKLGKKALRLLDIDEKQGDLSKREAYLSEATSRGIRPGEEGDGVEGRSFVVGEDREAAKPFAHFGEQLLAIRAAAEGHQAPDKRLGYVLEVANKEHRALGLGGVIDNDGGFLVQKDIAQGIHAKIHDTGQLLSRIKKHPIGGNSNGLELKAIDETSRVDGSQYGGAVAYWEAEGATGTKSKPQFRKQSLKVNKMFALYYATDELLQDASAIGSVVEDVFVSVMRWKAENAIVNGTGAGEPLGWMNAGAMVSVAKESSQVADSILAQNLNKMYARLQVGSLPTAVWLINQDVQPELDNLFYPVKNVAGTENVGGFASRVYDQEKGTIKGLPVIPVEYCQTIGDSGDILLVDPADYIMIDKGGIQAAASMHVQFFTDEMVFRLTWRLDGQPNQATALTPANGSNTTSTYLKLAVRS